MLGVSAGFSPGPLFALVLSQTLRHGTREGCKVALSPLITDLPVLLGATFLLKELSSVKPLLGGISFLGGLFLISMAYDAMRSGGAEVACDEGEPQSLMRGIVANTLSPHPYIFWTTIGAPTILRGWSFSPLAAVFFVVGFLGCLVSSKILLATLVGKSREFMAGPVYRNIMRVTGLLLLVYALLLMKEGASLVGLL